MKKYCIRDFYIGNSYIGEDGYTYLERIGLNGKPIEKTPETHPYSYDDFFVYKSNDFEIDDSMVYSDRMLSWNRVNFSNAARTVWGDERQIFFNCKPIEINKFLNLYFDKEVELTAIIQGCNSYNGFPYWIFAYKE